jgi:cephalosporin hydroxylase
MEINSLTPSVLGLDLLILPHAKSLIEQSKYAHAIQLWEGDSSSVVAQEVVTSFIQQISNPGPILLVLDSDHTEKHVLAELQNFANLLPVGSIVMVADTIIEEFPKDYYNNRPWNVGDNPLTAVRKFLGQDKRFSPEKKWHKRSLLSEFREGIIIKTVA